VTVDPAQQVACRRCGSLLNRSLDLDTGQARFTHPARQAADHEPDPVPADQTDTVYACDFCSDPHIVYTFHTARAIQTVVVTGTDQLVQDYGTEWSACLDCADLVHAGDLNGLHHRIMDVGPPFDPEVADRLNAMLAAVLATIQPGRTLASIGRWPPTPLPAAILPKVRDRLTRLLRGDDRLPIDLNDAHLRAQVTAGLDVARLYWIDDDFTDLVRHAAASLPRTAFTLADVPAPHGLLAWAQPVGDRADQVAASWSSGPAGTRIVGYRSIGAGLPPAALQHLREQVGWLVPRHTVTIESGQIIDAASPAGTLIASWLLIGQKLAETAPTPVDRSIRKAYQRAGRPTPEIRLVRIRGAAPVPERRAEHQAGEPSGREYQYRWWVRGHWRRQPYGPGRSQRKLIFIDPQVRGPAAKPIKASTTVRILGSQRIDPTAPHTD
jgi:hypothetical protein